jgi:hypothetical protein
MRRPKGALPLQHRTKENQMTDVNVRIYYRQNGTDVDGEATYDLSSFAGVLPAVGDTIVDPGVIGGRDRSEPANRVIWKVVERVFGPRDLEDYVVLVVEERRGTSRDAWL